MYLGIAKIGKVKTPHRANYVDAGIDFFVPEDLRQEDLNEKTLEAAEFKFDADGFVEWMRVRPGHGVLIPARIKVEVPVGYALIFMNKSGVATKHDLLVGSSVVDCGYAGQVHIDLHNVGQAHQVISAGQKLVQGLLIPVTPVQVTEVGEDELYADFPNLSNRGAGGFGSTGST